MFRLFGLIVLIVLLKLVLPKEISDLLGQIIVQILTILKNTISQVSV
ncbi:MAG: hypothetical protein ACOYMB_02005 [Patescibacteria group bacterium]